MGCHPQESRSNLLAEHGKMFIIFVDEAEGAKQQRVATTASLPPKCLPGTQNLLLV